MKKLWQYKWTIAMLPVAALGVCMYAYYIGFIHMDILPMDVRIFLMSPFRTFMDLFSEDVDYLIFSATLDYGGLVIGEVLCAYILYRIFLGMTKKRVTMLSEKKHLMYLSYALLWWFPVRVMWVVFLRMGE